MNTEITVFKRVQNTQKRCVEWEKAVYAAKSVRCEKTGELGENASVGKNLITARVFKEKSDVCVGDMLVLGRADGDEPPSDASIIISVCDNCRGSGYIRHTKIIAKG